MNLTLACKNHGPQQSRIRNKFEEIVGKEKGISRPASANDVLKLWQGKKRKALRNAGEEYTIRKGKVVPKTTLDLQALIIYLMMKKIIHLTLFGS